MRFTYSWLKDYVDIKLKPEELAEKLTMAGLEVESVQQSGADWVFEAEVTTNRPDWLSIVGIAREVAAVTGVSLRPRRVGSTANEVSEQPTRRWPQADIQVLDTQGCPRYTGRIINNVKVGPSPEWLKKRIQSIGLRPINNIVDITNFILFETGQPLHAFDFDRLKGAKLIVRRAKENEEITTIDNANRKLNSSILVISDEQSAVAIAGIMGGKNTEVTESTKNILLESAYFDPAIIRKASKSLGLSSDSSYRFERNVDYVAVRTASDRTADLILKIAGGRAGKLVDIAKKKYSSPKVSVRPQRVNDLLGIRIPAKEIISILKSLGLGVVSKSKAKPTFSIPSFRRDLKKEIDLIEEIIRIYGYDKIPSVQPKDIDVAERTFMPKRLEFQAEVRDTLISFGLNEVLTYSLTDKNIDEAFRDDSAMGRITIKNPLSPELATLRTNLTAGVLGAARWNLNRNINDIRLFEIGAVYSLDKLDAPEENYLSMCLSGSRTDNWQDGAKAVDFYYLKGIIEGLLAKLNIRQYDIVSSQNKLLATGQSADISINNQTIGFLGKAKKELLDKIDIEKDCFICQINLGKLISHVSFQRKFSPLPKYPFILRDISTLVKQDISSDQIASLIKQTAGDLIKDVKLFDVYAGQQIPKGHKSLIYRLTYQSPDKTLTDTEVDAVHSKVISALADKLGVRIR